MNNKITKSNMKIINILMLLIGGSIANVLSRRKQSGSNGGKSSYLPDARDLTGGLSSLPVVGELVETLGSLGKASAPSKKSSWPDAVMTLVNKQKPTSKLTSKTEQRKKPPVPLVVLKTSTEQPDETTALTNELTQSAEDLNKIESSTSGSEPTSSNKEPKVKDNKSNKRSTTRSQEPDATGRKPKVRHQISDKPHKKHKKRRRRKKKKSKTSKESSKRKGKRRLRKSIKESGRQKPRKKKPTKKPKPGKKGTTYGIIVRSN